MTAAVAKARILIIDDEPVVQDVLKRLLRRVGHTTVEAQSGSQGLELLAQDPPDLVILDVMLPDRNGVAVLESIKESFPDLPVIMMTAYGSVNNAVEAMKGGAFHYLSKPFANEEVLLLVEKALDTLRLREENRMLRSLLAGEGSFEGIVGRSEAIRSVFHLLEQVAPSRSTVLILGESGTGKELVARAVHRLSPRAAAPFISVHSGGIPGDLMESNLFGHVKGAFTGATSSREGLFQAADAGTLFFDEIGTLRHDLQTKLLRVLQERNFMPVGSTDSVSVDVRVLAATNADLKVLVERGEFREDLYYRLNVLKVELPPLRQRREDIRLLAEHFTRKHALENSKRLEGLDDEAMAMLAAYHWPGNVRELENAIIQGVVLARGRRLAAADLPAEVRQAAAMPEVGVERDSPMSLSEAVALYERRMIEEALAKVGGVQRQAARNLGIRPTTLNEKIKRLGLKNGA